MYANFEPPERLPWMSQAVCATVGLDLWFPDGNSVQVRQGELEAIRVCKSCPVRQDCLDHALDLGPNLQGIWGGTTPADRRQLLREIERGKTRRRLA